MLRQRSILWFVAILGLIVLGVAPVNAATVNNAQSLTLDCNGIQGGSASVTFDRDNTGTGKEAYHFEGLDGAGNQIYYFADSVSLGGPVPFGFTPWQSAPLYNPLTLKLISDAGNGLAEEVVYVWTGECPGLPTYSNLALQNSLPGPDMVPIPATAVVGSFVSTTPIYFAPQLDAGTDIVMEAGKTAWVYGVDASGAFYRVMLSGKFFWVPVSTMGPNYDDVWQGRPLPTEVVQ